MDIIYVPFEEHLRICLGEEIVKIIAFKTAEHGNVKFGVEASRSVQVHREEIYNAIKAQEKEDLVHQQKIVEEEIAEEMMT